MNGERSSWRGTVRSSSFGCRRPSHSKNTLPLPQKTGESVRYAVAECMFELNQAEDNALSALASLASEKVAVMTLSDTVLDLFERLRDPFTVICFASRTTLT